jgi:hypothetical protein
MDMLLITMSKLELTDFLWEVSRQLDHCAGNLNEMRRLITRRKQILMAIDAIRATESN